MKHSQRERYVARSTTKGHCNQAGLNNWKNIQWSTTTYHTKNVLELWYCYVLELFWNPLFLENDKRKQNKEKSCREKLLQFKP